MMTIQKLSDNLLTLKWVEDADIYENNLVLTDMEDVILARIPLDITPKTDMAKVYINKTYLEPKDIEQRTDEERQEAFNELVEQKNAILRKLKKRDRGKCWCE